jgi:hypothetical protein
MTIEERLIDLLTDHADIPALRPINAVGLLLIQFSREHDWENDEDPSATQEVLMEAQNCVNGLITLLNEATVAQEHLVGAPTTGQEKWIKTGD